MPTNAEPAITHGKQRNASSSTSRVCPDIKPIALMSIVSEPGELMDVGRTIESTEFPPAFDKKGATGSYCLNDGGFSSAWESLAWKATRDVAAILDSHSHRPITAICLEGQIARAQQRPDLYYSAEARIGRLHQFL